jgi:hypothetical protein
VARFIWRAAGRSLQLAAAGSDDGTGGERGVGGGGEECGLVRCRGKHAFMAAKDRRRRP